MFDLTKEQKGILIGIAAILISAVMYGAYNKFIKPSEIEIYSSTPALESDPKKGGVSIFVHVSGAVKREGVYRLCAGSRLLDAVNIAGGFAPRADISSVNLAEELKDQSKINVPYKAKKPASSIASSGSVAGPININCAGEEELQKIPGVGKVTAQKIIEFRQKNGIFTIIEDLKKIGGIGDKKLEKMKPYISVN